MFIALKKPQAIVLAAGSVQSAGFSTAMVVVWPQVDIFLNIGPDPVATANGNESHFLPGGEVLMLSTSPGHKLAAIPASGNSGNVYLSEV